MTTRSLTYHQVHDYGTLVTTGLSRATRVNRYSEGMGQHGKVYRGDDIELEFISLSIYLHFLRLGNSLEMFSVYNSTIGAVFYFISNLRCLSYHLNELASGAPILLTCKIRMLSCLRMLNLVGCSYAYSDICSWLKLYFQSLPIVSEVICAWLWKLLCYLFRLTLTHSVLKYWVVELLKRVFLIWP